jgi:peptidoglycan hydrolase-like protein with peptidoglycan-binding domain
MANNNSVKCLQEFLKNQGAGIYPEGLITGNFGSLTKQAVIRFQEKYTAEILTPVGLSSGTGYVGEKTRQKINQML